MTDRRSFLARAAAAAAALVANKHIAKADTPVPDIPKMTGTVIKGGDLRIAANGRDVYPVNSKTNTVSYVGGLPNGTVRLDGIDVTDVSSIWLTEDKVQSTSRVARGRGEVVTWIPIPGKDFDRCAIEPTGLQDFTYHGWVEFERPLERYGVTGGYKWRGHKWLKDSE